MDIQIHIANLENVGLVGPEELERFGEIITALIQSGGLTGVKGGKTIIHFDGSGTFMGVQLDYWPFRRKNAEK